MLGPLGKGSLLLCKLYLHLLGSPVKFCQQILSTIDKLKDVCNFNNCLNAFQLKRECLHINLYSIN